MAASQEAVGTGGKSAARLRISAAPLWSGMVTLLDHFDQVAEGRRFGGFGVYEEDRGAARTLAGSFVDDLESVLFQIIEGLLNRGHPQGHVRQAAPPAVL